MECEARGIPADIPVGTIFNEPGGFYDDFTFVVAECRAKRHYRELSYWAFRTNSAGDSLNTKDICGGNDSSTPTVAVDQSLPTFKRAVAFCVRNGITPQLWDGEKAVPYTEAK
jgi:hypothetical protein